MLNYKSDAATSTRRRRRCHQGNLRGTVVAKRLKCDTLKWNLYKIELHLKVVLLRTDIVVLLLQQTIFAALAPLCQPILWSSTSPPRCLPSVLPKLNIDYENNKQKLRNFLLPDSGSGSGITSGRGRGIRVRGRLDALAQVSIDWLPLGRVHNKEEASASSSSLSEQTALANQRVLIFPEDSPRISASAPLLIRRPRT